MGHSRSKSLKSKIHRITHGHCAYCGKGLNKRAMTVDHIRPISKGGKNSMKNYLPACQECNCMKGSRHIDKWRVLAKKLGKLYKDDLFYFEVMA